VTVNNFLQGGGDNFTVFQSGTNPVVGPVDLDALVTYIKSLTQPFNAVIEGRITRVN
jgi:5'-nucleotidase